MTICAKCGIDKPFTTEYFHKHIISRKYRHKTTSCIECHKKRMKLYNGTYYKNNRDAELFKIYRKEDIRKGFDNDLSEEWLRDNITTKSCFYCGTTSRPIGADRIDNSKGHTQENVVPCCKICNKVRNNIFSVDEMKMLGKVIATFAKL